MRVKLCGLKDEEGVRAALEAGPDAVGFVFADSPRQVLPMEARWLRELVPPHVEVFAVFRVPDPWLLDVALDAGVDAIQAYASWDPAGLPEGIGFLPVFRDSPTLVAELSRFTPNHRPPRFARALVDGPGGGGTGEAAVWERVALACALGGVALAGGLDPMNVGEAIVAVRPVGVDVSSGIERAPGVKDRARIEAFVRAARTATRSV